VQKIGDAPQIDARYFEPLIDAGILVASPHTTIAQANAAVPDFDGMEQLSL
jgi:hypothetical protein